jgi:uncharacterized protein YajQ (UPF0234 family)
MPSFDVVSQVDLQEVRNAVDQANREITNRYDFKGTDSRVEQNEQLLIVYADDEFKLGQVVDILHAKLAKRKVDLASLQGKDVEVTGGGKAKQEVTVRQGIDQGLAKKIVKMVKDSKLKVQTAIQGDQVRISGKKRDDLQQVIALLNETDLGMPLQYVNFRD